MKILKGDTKISLKNKILNIKNLYVYLIAFFSSILTFVFFYFSSEVIKEDKIVEEKIDIYEVGVILHILL